MSRFATEQVKRDGKDLEVGETTRVNHDDCSAGVDERRRLYITRPLSNPSFLVWYCHNCQQGGRTGDGEYQDYRDERHKPTTSAIKQVSTELELPQNTLPVSDWSNWPSYAKAWAMQNSLHYLPDIGIAFDPDSDRVVLPRWDEVHIKSNGTTDLDDSVLIGYQLRNVNGRSQAKYLTAERDVAIGQYTRLIPSVEEVNDYAVIVEDLVSGLHIAKASCDPRYKGGKKPVVYVNYGVKINPTLMYTLAAYDYVTVWLDNDSKHVERQANQMIRTIGLYNPNINLAQVRTCEDPKHYCAEEIIRTLDEVWHNG